MVQGRAFLLACATALAAAGALAACSGDDTNGTAPTADGGTDGTAPDGSPNHDGGTDTGPGTDAGDGGDACDFNTFVIGLIQNHTNNTDLPSTDLGQNCTDTHTAFPSTVFQ